MDFISPKDIIVEFLRVHMTDPRARAEALKTNTFDGAVTSFTLAPTTGRTAYCLTSVKVGGVEQKKYTDYYFNEQDQKVIFYIAPVAGTLNVAIIFKEGTSNWVYPDKAKESLSTTSFPRISIMKVAGAGKRLGQYNSNVETVSQFQIDIWVKEDYVATLGSIKYAEEKLAEYLAYQILNAFKLYEADLFSQLYNYTLLSGPRDLGFDKTYQCFHEIVEVELKSIDSGNV